MIDRSARNAMAGAARYYLTGLSANFEFDYRLVDLKSQDPAIDAIRNQLWFIYDDLQAHRHEEDWRLTTEHRETVSRIIMFLKSDFEYQWPHMPKWYSKGRPLIRLLTRGIGSRALDRSFEFQDPEHVWPFHDRRQVDQVKDTPPDLHSAT